MSYIVNEKAEEVFNLLKKSMNSTNMDLQTAAGTFQNFGVELTDKDIYEFERNLENCWTNLKKVTDHVRTIYRGALDLKPGGMYDLNSDFNVVNLTMEEMMKSNGLNREQLLNKVDHTLNFTDLTLENRQKLERIKSNLIELIKRDQRL